MTTNKRRLNLTLFALLLLAWIAPSTHGQAPQKPRPAAPDSSCSRANALEIIRQQLDTARTFDDAVQRITVTLRAADLLWLYQQDKARAAFAESFELAVRNYKENGIQTTKEGRMSVQGADQRYTAITAIARRDRAWARKLSDQMLQDETKEAEEKTKDSSQDANTADRLLIMAHSLVTSDPLAALTFARSSLRYPATLQLPFFLYHLAEVNKPAADQFYQEALSAYAGAPMAQFLYLSSYPFGNNREAGEMPSWSFYPVPGGFVPNPTLQSLFLQTLLSRAHQLVENPTAPAPGSRYSEAAQIWMALTRLQPQVTSGAPDLAAAVQQSKESILALLSQKDQQTVNDALADPPAKSFDELVEAAEKQADPDRREAGLALAVMNVAANAETLDHVVAAADKIADPTLRQQVLSQLYFNRTQRAIKDLKLDEARRLATKVDELDQRAYLYSQIVTESIKQTKSDAVVRELLDEVIAASAKAPDTETKARALLGVAYLYTKVDANRAVSVLGDAIKCINHIASPDFSRDYVIKHIEGKAFGSYRTLQTPSFNPENAFRELGKVDFDGTLYQASNFTDKSLRALTTLALVEGCLKQQQPEPKPEKPKKKPAP